MLCGMAVLAELWAHFCLVPAMLDFIHSTISCSLLPGRHTESFHGRSGTSRSSQIFLSLKRFLRLQRMSGALQETNKTTTFSEKFCITVKFLILCTLYQKEVEYFAH